MSDGKPKNKYIESHKTSLRAKLYGKNEQDINPNFLYTNNTTMYDYFTKQRRSEEFRSASFKSTFSQSCSTGPTVPGVAIDMINTTSGLTPEEKSTLMKVKHSNDPILNTRWGPNEYWGQTDMNGEALDALSKIAKNHKKT